MVMIYVKCKIIVYPYSIVTHRREMYLYLYVFMILFDIQSI